MTYSDVMTQNQDDYFNDLASPSIPSRTVLSSTLQDGLLKRSVFSSNVFIYHFDDIRDAIDLVLKGLRETEGDKHSFPKIGITISTPPDIKAPHQPLLVFHLNNHNNQNSKNHFKMNELFERENVRFACSRISERLVNEQCPDGGKAIYLQSAVVMISISFERNRTDDCGPVAFERVDAIVEALKRFVEDYGGPVLAYSDLRRNTDGGTRFKFFAEFYRVEHCQRFLSKSSSIGPICDHSIEVSFEGVSLYDVDREALFFNGDSMTICAENNNISNPHHHPRKDSINSLEGGDDFYTSNNNNSNNSNNITNIITCNTTSSTSSSSSSSFSSNNSNTTATNVYFEIDLWKVEKGIDRRTTCMIRNIPNKYSQQMIFDLVNETHAGCFDFLYLRMDFRNRCNVGYAFINFTRPEHVISFAGRVHGKRWARFNSDKVCNLTFARIQGLDALIEKFRASKVMFEAPAYRPKLFHTEGPLTGHEIPFPTPNTMINNNKY